jgi:hypothetical protein
MPLQRSHEKPDGVAGAPTFATATRTLIRCGGRRSPRPATLAHQRPQTRTQRSYEVGAQPTAPSPSTHQPPSPTHSDRPPHVRTGSSDLSHAPAPPPRTPSRRVRHASTFDKRWRLSAIHPASKSNPSSRVAPLARPSSGIQTLARHHQYPGRPLVEPNESAFSEPIMKVTT